MGIKWHDFAVNKGRYSGTVMSQNRLYDWPHPKALAGRKRLSQETKKARTGLFSYGAARKSPEIRALLEAPLPQESPPLRVLIQPQDACPTKTAPAVVRGAGLCAYDSSVCSICEDTIETQHYKLRTLPRFEGTLPASVSESVPLGKVIGD